MRKSILILFIFFHFLISCSSYSLSELSQEELLNLAYEENSIELLSVFFERWQTEYSNETLKPKLNNDEKIIEEIFNDLYNYVDIGFYRIKNPIQTVETKLKPYTPQISKYVNRYKIIQKEINYTITDSLIYYDDYIEGGKERFIIREGKIENFRPKIPLIKKAVYLTSKYEKILKKFFNYPNKNVSEEKEHFFWNKALISPRRRKYVSDPKISVYLKPKYNEALIYLFFTFGGDLARIVKKNDEWEIIEIRTLWIE